MKIFYSLIFICCLASNVLTAQTFEQPFEIENKNFTFFDIAVKGDQVYMIGSHGQFTQDISIYQYKASRWEEISNVVFENGINRKIATKPKTDRDPQNNPKIYIDENNDLWVTGNAVYHRKNNVWKSYRPPIKTNDFDSLYYYQFHELYFLLNKSPIISALITTLGPKYNGFRIGFFEIFTLRNDSLYHTNFEKNVNNVKASSQFMADESKMTVIGDTIVVYKADGTIFFVNPDGSIDSTKFPGNKLQLSSNLEIRQILPVGPSKLIILTDKSKNSIQGNQDCCSGMFVLENRKDWTVIDERYGLYKNIRNNLYSGRSIIPTSDGGHLVALFPNNPVGLFSQVYSFNEDFVVTHIPFNNSMSNAVVYPRRNYIQGISQENYSNILEAMRTNDMSANIANAEILKIRLDGFGNLWCMMEDFILQIPAFIPTSVDETTNSKGNITVNPNPAKEKLFLTSIPIDCEKLEIISIHGQTVKIVSSDFQNIDIQTLPSGVYMLKAYSKTRFQTTTFMKVN